jgi:hypothetical protein
MFVIQMEEVFLIRRKDFKLPEFFLVEYSLNPISADLDIAKWTSFVKRAKEFYTEETVETFKYEYMRARPCEIVRIRNC